MAIAVSILFNTNELSNLAAHEFWMYYGNNVFLFIIPAILIDAITPHGRWYLSGFNMDRYAVRDIATGSALAIVSVAIIVYAATSGKSPCQSQTAVFSTTSALYACNDAAVEELIFRGFVFQNIIRRKNPVLVAILSSLSFAALHDFTSSLHFINIFIAGILFCCMYIKTKALWLPVSFHISWNLLLGFVGNSSMEAHISCTIILLILIYIIEKYMPPSFHISAAWYTREYAR